MRKLTKKISRFSEGVDDVEFVECIYALFTSQAQTQTALAAKENADNHKRTEDDALTVI